MSRSVVRLRDHAYSSFTKHLLARAIMPGQIVSQRELVELTGMPLGAIREMIPRLEADGLIRTAPNRGLQVMSIDLNLIRDAFQLRRMIETEAVAQFCRSAPDEEIARLAEAHDEIIACAQNDIDEALLERAQALDWALHDDMVEHMQNRILSEVYRVNTIKIRLMGSSDTRISPDLLVSVMQEHKPILTALQARDETAAVAAICAHIQSAKRRALHL